MVFSQLGSATGNDLDFLGSIGNDSWSSYLDSGLTQASGLLGDSITSGLDWLTANQDAVNTGVGLLGTLGNTYSTISMANTMQEQMANEEAERQRQIALQNQGISDYTSGYSASGLVNPNKRTTATNYYSV